MNEQYSQAVAAIEAADLTAPIYRTARRLLDLAAEHDGYLELTPTAMQELCGKASEGTMRAHLIQMALGNILAYNVSQKQGRIAIRFAAYPIPIIESWSIEEITQRAKTRAQRSFLITGRAEKITERANLITGRAEKITERSPDDPAPDESAEMEITERAKKITQRANLITERSEPTDAVNLGSPSDQKRSPSDQNRASSDQIRALSDLLGGTIGGVGWLVGSDPIPSFSDLPTNQPTRLDEGEADAANEPTPEAQNQVPREPRPNPLDQARSMALLLDAGVIPHNAKRLSAAHPFERVQRTVGYWVEGKGVKFAESPGLVVTLLDDWNKAGVPVELPRAFLASELYRRHRTPTQIAADEERQAQCVIRTGLERAPLPAPEPTPPPVDPLGKLWQDTLACYQEHTRFLLRDTQLSTDGDRAVVVGPYKLQTIFERMAWKILKDLRFGGLTVSSVVFQPQEVAHG